LIPCAVDNVDAVDTVSALLLTLDTLCG